VFLCLLRRAAGNALGLTRLRQYSSPVRSEGTTEDTTLAGEGDNFLCALQVPHPQRPVTRARDGARALDDQLLLHGKARPLCGQDARGMHLTTLRFIRGWRQIQMTPPAIRSACFTERPSTERLQTS
jgi:hypothetical protein